MLVVGKGFVGTLFAAVVRHRGREVFAVDFDPRRTGPAPDGPVDAVVLSGHGGVDTALDVIAPGGTILVFADAGAIPAAEVYRRELTLIGTRSAAPQLMPEAVDLLGVLPSPSRPCCHSSASPRVSSCFAERDVLKVVFTP